MAFWVIGGEYSDTSFTTLVPGTAAECLGPFQTYREAYTVWSTRARATIDDATVRFRIVEEGVRRESGAAA